jgi:predicted aspartyl protease
MKRLATAFVLPLLVVSSSETGPSATAVQKTAAAPTAIAFELANRHVIVKVSINRSRPLSFVLDTGAHVAIVRLDVAKELGLSLAGDVNVGGAGPGQQAGRRIQSARWSFVGLEAFTQPVSLALPLPALPAAMGRDIDGIIGGEFIREFVVELDYQARVITLHNRETFAYSGRGETLPLEFNANNHPVLKATVTLTDGTAIERSFLLDTGSGLALALHSPFVTEQNLLGPQSKTIRAIGGAGAGGRTTGRVGRVTALQIGSFTFRNPIALFSEDKAGAFADASLAGNIGAQIASRFRTFLDYRRRRIILEPSPTFADPFDRAFSGVALRAEGQRYETIRVRDVLEDSPATEAGIAVDDVIVSIVGTAAGSLPLTTINEMLEQPVARQLEVRRGEQVIKVTLTPKALI